MTIENILVVMRAEPEHLALLAEAAPGARVVRQSVKDLKPEQVEQADVVVGNLPAAFLPHMRKARLLQLNSAGVGPEYLKLRESLPELVLCCASGAYGQAISEHMLASLLALMKRLHQYRDGQKTGRWESRGSVVSPRGMNVLILGLGDIGGRFAKIMQPFDAQVIGIRRRPSAPPEGVARVATMEELDSLLPWADVIAMALPDTEDTRQVMDARRFRMIKPGSYFLNVGRGASVDQDALLDALRTGRLAGASIDVTTPEPCPATIPLAGRNLLLTPHISGAYHLRQTLDNIHAIAAHNIRALPTGRSAPGWILTRGTGHKSAAESAAFHRGEGLSRY